MLVMRGGFSSLKTMDAAPSVHASTTSLQSSIINNPAVRNNNKAVSFKSQSPSEDESIRLYRGVSLPCETDHMYANYPSDSGKQELAEEVSHLKAMVLFHLDLIQQQSECNAAKDKQLSSLRHENEMLRQRLERMERRVQLQHSKQKPEVGEDSSSGGGRSEPLPSQSPITNNIVDPRPLVKVPVITPTVPQVPELFITNSSETDPEAVPRKRIKTLLPVRTKPTPSPTSRRKSASKSTEETLSSVDEDILDNLINQAVKEGAIINLTDTVASDHVVEAKIVLDSCPSPVLPSERKASSPEPDFSILPEHRRIQQLLLQKPALREPQHLRRESILTTQEPYPTHVGECLNQPEAPTNEVQVEVPQWVIKPLSGRSSSQDIENLDDEIFTKRHLKHEIDEKRRKRWDLQRIREQRQYEKLRARYEGEDRSQDRVRTTQTSSRNVSSASDPSSSSSNNTNTSSSAALTSLWAGPEDVTHVQIEPWLPVSVFGAPLPNLALSDFQLPWSNSRSMEFLQTRNSTERRRQRRSLKD